MRFYVFTEQPYPDALGLDVPSLRVNLPNDVCDPETAAAYYHQHLDEWQLADELGLDIFVNEHHATATCLTASSTIILGILARTTKRARLLALGSPLPHRADPVRVAEELSMIDVISRGRLEMGFVKGVPYEIVPSNTNPVHLNSRFWEAHDLILKAMTHRGGPFSWEGEHYHHRSVNIWPRPYQQPHPPVWITSSSLGSVKAIAAKGYVLGTVLTGYAARPLYEEYRKVWFASGRTGPFPIDRLCYTAFVSCGETRSEAFARAHEVGGYLRTSAIVEQQFKTPPGYVPAAAMATLGASGGRTRPQGVVSRNGRTIATFAAATPEQLIEGGLMFAGTPDEVYRQITDFYDAVGGFHHLNIMTHSGAMTFKDVAANMTLFATHVAPRLRDFARQRQAAIGA